jgi:hypothetical protein
MEEVVIFEDTTTFIRVIFLLLPEGMKENAHGMHHIASAVA